MVRIHSPRPTYRNRIQHLRETARRSTAGPFLLVVPIIVQRPAVSLPSGTARVVSNVDLDLEPEPKRRYVFRVEPIGEGHAALGLLPFGRVEPRNENAAQGPSKRDCQRSYPMTMLRGSASVESVSVSARPDRGASRSTPHHAIGATETRAPQRLGLEYGKLMPEGEHLRLELETRPNGRPERRLEGDEQRGHAAADGISLGLPRQRPQQVPNVWQGQGARDARGSLHVLPNPATIRSNDYADRGSSRPTRARI